MRQINIQQILFLMMITGSGIRAQNCSDQSEVPVKNVCENTSQKIVLLQELIQEQIKNFQDWGCANNSESEHENNTSTPEYEDVARPHDCQEIYKLGYRESVVYDIYLDSDTNTPLKVFCDMDTEGGGWTVIQRRVSNTDFYRNWQEYKQGFGDPAENYWLGNNIIHAITTSGNYELRIDLRAPSNESRYAKYASFSVGNEDSKYSLSISGYSGTAGDSLKRHNGMKFSTKDQDNDIYTGSCATMYHGGWWYDACHESNLNGLYGNNSYGQGLNWRAWKGYYVSMIRTEMKIREK